MLKTETNFKPRLRLAAGVLLVTALIAFYSPAGPAGEVAEKDWGIAAGFRIARIPYPTEEEQVSDFIPLMFYGGDIFTCAA